MKTVYENLSPIISDLDQICSTLESLRKRMEIAIPRVFVDDYFKILVACEQLKGVIEGLKGVIRETKSVPPQQKMANP